MTSRQRSVSINRFLGLNKKADPMELRASRKGYELAEALNVDITDNRKLRRRKGYAMWREVVCRKIWSDGNVFVSLEGTDLKDLSDINNVSTLNNDMHSTKLPSFTTAGKEVYYSDGRVTGKIDEDGNHTDWEVEEPLSFPNIASTTGSLYEGFYHVSCTFVHDDGRESGTGVSITQELTASGGIALTSIPQPSSANIASINIYMTEANGGILRRAATLAVGTTSFNITSRTLGAELKTQFLSPPPASEHVAYAGSRVAVAIDNFLFYSEPFSYHLFNMGEKFLTFPEPINLISATEKGLYVSAGNTYFVSISDPTPKRKRVSNSPAITGTAFQIDGAEVGDGERDEVFAGWVAENGIILGSEAGSVQNMTESRIDIGTAPNGAAIARKTNGVTQVVTTLNQPTGTNMFIGDVVTATVKKRDILEDFNLIDHDGDAVVDHAGEPVISED